MSKTTHDKGNETRAQILDVIVNYMLAYGYPPTNREICARVGLKSTSTIHHHLTIMEDRGLITRNGNEPRTITVIGVRYIDERNGGR